MTDFVHLHCHTQFSLLDGAAQIPAMMDKALADGQKAVALTDHGNMFGAFKFVAEANKRGLKPIVGCEFYIVKDRHKQSFLTSRGEKDKRYHQLLLAKNQTGYQNLSKLCSLGFIEGMYSKFPRIDKELLLQYHEGIIATSCCIGAEIPQTILKGTHEEAEELVKWWLDLFGEDFYIELQRHRGMENIDGSGISQEDVNQVLIGFAQKYNIKTICTNDSHYLEEDDWKPHDLLLCVNTNNKVEEFNRFKFPSSDFYFKTREEMQMLFEDIPEALENTIEIYDKVTAPQLTRDILLPNFPLPSEFKNQSDFLRDLVYKGAKQRYGEINEVVRERVDLELSIIGSMEYEGYFLIVQDFIAAARNMGVSVGPGRGSAAGSVVAYCLNITNLDPIKYNLLFERFLNPERVSMPDIDIDFDDEGRQDVIDWVVEKYGRNKVAQIITFGTMAARSSIRDVGRVMGVPLDTTDRLAKLVPSRPGTKLVDIFKPAKETEKLFAKDDLPNVRQLNEVMSRSGDEADLLNMAVRLEGTVRNTGIHAAGIIIAPDDLTNLIPVSTSKESKLLVTQFDGTLVEAAGMLKMDFLGLKTLSIIKDCIKNIGYRFGKEKTIDPDNFPLDDEKTYALFQKAETIGIFQFESDSMRKYLKDLKPTEIEDLIAMNALHRPGPMDYIPSFVNRKHGREKVEYPHEWLEEILKPTYGIMVYQEQIMRTAQIMADYSLGKADMLRRAMGKKKIKAMEEHRKIFVDGAVVKGVDADQAENIFEIMIKFASYGFNRSHAAAYSVLAYQTAYLKVHYPAEFMAAVLTHNKSDIGKLHFFLRECRRIGLDVLQPDMNESWLNFTVNDKGQIRFGLSALKNLGEKAVQNILDERKKNGEFSSLFDMVRRLSLRAVNKKSLESLVLGGALDSFEGLHRAQYFTPAGKFATFIENVIEYGKAYQSRKDNPARPSLFGVSDAFVLDEPKVPEAEEWPLIQKLNHEKQVTGIYMTGHPLDDYRLEVENFTNCPLDMIEKFPDRKLKIAGIVTDSQHRISRKGTGWGVFSIEDFRGTLQVRLFSEDYKKYRNLFDLHEVLYLEGFYQKRWNGSEYSFQVTDVRLLDSIGDEMTKWITLQIPVEFISEELISGIESLCKHNKGTHKLKLQVYHRDEEVVLGLLSKAYNVKVDGEFIDQISKFGIKYKLN
jgi:DNA polymerase III subunit alpha